MPDGTVVQIQARLLTLEVDRDYIDASAFDGRTTYLVATRTFTIRGELL